MMEKMNALKTALDGMCSDSIPTSTVQQLIYPVTWISIPFTQIGTTNLKHAGHSPSLFQVLYPLILERY